MCKMILDFFSRRHGFAKIILPVQFPSVVEPNSPFAIKYTIRNTGQVSDVLWAKLLVDGKLLPNSYWSKRIPVGGSVTKTYTHTGINKNTVIILQTGY